MRFLGGLLVVLGLVADVLCVLARVSAYWRAGCVLLWWPGLAVLVAACRGVDVVLHWKGMRQVRPWEGGEGLDWAAGEEEKSGEEGWREHKRMDTASSAGSSVLSVASSRVDPLRKPSLQVFGPENEYAKEDWVNGYREKGWMQKVFDETVVVQSKALVLWQDRTVFFALLWGGAGAAALTVVSLFVPSAMLF